MRKFIILGFLLAATAAQAQLSEPKSNQSGNILNGSSHDVANQLPAPQADANSEAGLLTAAISALQAHRTGEAQEALEQAETLALTRAVPQSEGNMPITDPQVTRISQARWALGAKNIPRALIAAQAALNWAESH